MGWKHRIKPNRETDITVKNKQTAVDTLYKRGRVSTVSCCARSGCPVEVTASVRRIITWIAVLFFYVNPGSSEIAAIHAYMSRYTQHSFNTCLCAGPSKRGSAKY